MTINLNNNLLLHIFNLITDLMDELIFNGRKQGNILFNDALSTFYLRLYGVGHIMVNDYLDSERKPAVATIWATISD